MTPQALHILAVMEEAIIPLYLWQMQAAIREKFGVVYETTGISARIRNDIRPYLENRKKGRRTIYSRKGNGRQAHVYWIGKIAKK